MPEERLKALIETAHKHEHGFRLSSGFLSIPTEDWAELIELTAKHGLKPKPEVGIQWGAGGDASVEELENAGTRDPKWLIDRAKTFLEAGAYV
ncbi:hypothetical protein K474DRAFT_1665083 [Panus rudis PR-1116 ss-1]|nr:hypothetical protein K474DRAFT_1665083 [Panus rudis PR-1116 ss-1]